jgi:hypothetical protein
LTFSPDGSSAYAPGVVLVHGADLGRLPGSVLKIWELVDDDTEGTYRKLRAEDPKPDARTTAADLRSQGIRAQVDHMFFATAMDAAAMVGGPLYGSPLYGSPLYGSPLYGSPLYGSPLYGSPLYGSAISIPAIQETGNRRSTAIPARRPEFPPPKDPPNGDGIRIAIVDTGFPSAGLIKATSLTGGFSDRSANSPLTDPDNPDPRGNGYLDPYAGHGIFIAGIIEQLIPGCEFEFWRVLSPQGHGSESDVVKVLNEIAKNPPHLVNLSFAGYVEAGAGGIGAMGALANAVQSLQQKHTIIVAAAGNDRQWAPAFPAALEGVISVAALDEWGYPAPFTNHGPWVRACAVGVNLVSFFFKDFTDKDWKFYGYQGEHFKTGWARWTGTSFAAPQVVARLAMAMKRSAQAQAGAQPLAAGPAQDLAETAITSVLGSPDDKFRYPNFGTVVTAFEPS